MNNAPEELTAAENTPLVGSFVDHRKVVLDLSNDLRALAKHSQEVGLDGTASEIMAVLNRMASDKFSVAVVGEFNRGKSTFINALLGTEVLPMDVLPTTATLNRVTYGFDKRAVIAYRDGRAEEIAYDALPAYITKLSDQSERVAASIKEATVYYPSPYCHNNVDVIDTPGLNEDPAMTSVTFNSLAGADAAIMLILAQSPFGEYEREFLESRLLTADLGRVIFVVNCIDLFKTPAEASRVIGNIKERITTNVMKRAKARFGENSSEYTAYEQKIGTPKVFGISAREALEAKRANDLQRLERSGFPQLESYLQTFLTERRGVLMLQVPLNRCASAARDIIDAVTTAEGALSLKADEFEHACRASEAEVAALRETWEVEKRRLHDAEVLLRHGARELATQYLHDYRVAGLTAIAKENIGADDIADKAAKARLHERVGKSVETAIGAVVDDYAEKMETLISERLLREGERLANWSDQVQQLMPRIRRRFAGESGPSRATPIADRVVDGVSFLMPIAAGGLSGFRTAGVKGVVTGVAGGVAGSMLVGSVLFLASTVVALPALPVILAMGGGSFIGGRILTKKVLKQTMVQRYIDELSDNFSHQLSIEMPTAHLEAEFERVASKYFESFYQQVASKSEAALADGMSVITRRRTDVVREQTNVAGHRERLAAIRSDVESIAARAARLSRQLVHSVEVPREQSAL